jgi:hypothetical protein
MNLLFIKENQIEIFFRIGKGLRQGLIKDLVEDLMPGGLTVLQ